MFTQLVKRSQIPFQRASFLNAHNVRLFSSSHQDREVYLSEKIGERQFKRRVGNYEEIFDVEVRKETLLDM